MDLISNDKVYLVYVNHVLMHTFKEVKSAYYYARGLLKRKFDEDKCYDIHICERINYAPSRQENSKKDP